MRSLSRRASTALAIAVLVAGCSSNSNNNKDGSSSSEPAPTTLLVDLTPTQFHQLCLQESPSGASGISCAADAEDRPVALGVCTSIQPDCSATVATSQTCASRLTADACNYTAYTADLATPECLVMQECMQNLCTNANFLCATHDTLTTALTTCTTFTKGLTTDCASCIAGIFAAAPSCPDFTKLPSPYDQCAATCAAHGG
jgi:hypothetical protein